MTKIPLIEIDIGLFEIGLPHETHPEWEDLTFIVREAKSIAAAKKRIRDFIAFVRGEEPEKGDPLADFNWLEEAAFVPDNQGGHINFAGKTWRPEKSTP